MVPDNSSNLASDVGRTLGAYLRGQLIIAGILTLIYLGGFFVIGLPWWGLAAVLCGLFNLVPLVGGVVGVILPLVFVLFGDGDWTQALWVIVLFALAQLLESLYLSPRILGRELSLRPLVVFCVVLVGGMIFGPLGAIAAAPVTAVALLVHRRWHGSR